MAYDLKKKNSVMNRVRISIHISCDLHKKNNFIQTTRSIRGQTQFFMSWVLAILPPSIYKRKKGKIQ